MILPPLRSCRICQRYSLMTTSSVILPPLSKLTKLSMLHLENNQIQDITPLTKLWRLIELDSWGKSDS